MQKRSSVGIASLLILNRVKFRCFILFQLAVFSIFLPVRESLAATEDEDNPVVVRALSDASSVEAGGSFRLGVLFEMEKPWHIYWRNPGDAGLPTRIEFELPNEFTSGDLQWPVPMTFSQAGGIQGFGYVHEALFWKEVTLSQDSALQGEVEIPVNIRWLRCSESLCVPGRSKQKLKLTVGARKDSNEKEIFDSWQGRYPLSDQDFGKTGSVSIDAGQIDTKKWAVSLNWQQQMASTRWYVVVDNAYLLETNPKMGVEQLVEGNQSLFTLSVKSRDGLTPKSQSMYAVVVGKTTSGDERALSLELSKDH